MFLSRSNLQKVSFKARTIKILLIVSLFVVSGWFWYATETNKVVSCGGKEGNFACGQYYFNHDDDPEGPYDLVLARQYYEAAIEENPTQNVLLWYQLGRIDFIEGKFADALDKFSKQTEYFADKVPNVYYMIGLTYGYQARREGDEKAWVLAEKNFQKFIAYSPSTAWPRVDLAWVYFAQGKYEEMIPVLEYGLTFNPDNAWLLNMYGLALLNTDRTEEAREKFTDALTSANNLTEEDWGKTYPGNSPNDWRVGLAEFKSAIETNLQLTN